MLTADKVKQIAREAGADIVAIGPVSRLEGAPKQYDARYMLPSAKSIIAFGFRHARGCFRGIEEGTFFSAYNTMGYASINYIYQPYVLCQVARAIEDEGYDALPLPNNFPWNAVNVGGQGTLEESQKANPGMSRPPAPGKPAPNVFIQLRIACFAAGLGEIGFSKMFLSKQFGPRQRLAAILTDAEFDYDEQYEPGTVCDKCMACVHACTGNAIPTDRMIKIRVGDRDVEWADIDMKKCSTFFCGGAPEKNPFCTTEEDREKFGATVGVAQAHKCKPVYMYSRALEGAAGCIRACMIHLEEQGKIASQFENRFRKKKQWTMETP
ncbi:MAG: hypothetical protein KAI66_03020 [Lentisphaeria bacterium]|nr:hypothetical protein [Lentisphaeria bacterium]